MGKYLDKPGLTYYHGLLKNLFQDKTSYSSHKHTFQKKTGTSGSATTGTVSIPNITKKTVVLSGDKTQIPNISVESKSIPNVTSAGSAPTLGTPFSIPNVTSAGSAATFEVTDDVLVITSGSAPTLGTNFSVPNVTDVGAAPTLGTAIQVGSATAGTPIEAYTSLTTGDSITVGASTDVTVVTGATFNTVVTNVDTTISGGTTVNTSTPA